MRIRTAFPEDCIAIEECARSAYEKYIVRIGKEPAPMVADFASQIADGQVLVMEDDSGLLAYAICYANGDCMQLDNIAVLPDHQSKGYGRKLLEHIQNMARAGGFRAVTLYTNEKMVENLQWYVKCGYTEIARRRESGFNRVFFRKKI